MKKICAINYFHFVGAKSAVIDILQFWTENVNFSEFGKHILQKDTPNGVKRIAFFTHS